ncbi:hypothetical protein B1C78_12240 [Thioalkalivibrio denitrificans]|uniref:Nucleoprotein/polynucleotide-associated enzyme n=1 Tax=Thioalkalivibrio denitrificans TaxID=108003 RepID=A0A1V3NDH5_9GAMM|nr:DUF2058 domain-containing protein [Thioalkalivibrio denitrificans]OOG23157.1 hypothetical protein B1C78_12240 [Thioalkalivibrio denitrificans]
MSDSLREQLLKAGLVDEKKLRQSRQAGNKHKGGRKRDTGRRAPGADKAREQQAQRSRELNRKQQEAARRKALAAEIGQIVREHRLSRDDADQAYHFPHGDRIRSVHVTAEQRDGLARGRLGVVTFAGGYELLPQQALEKVRERDADRVVVFNEPHHENDTPPAEDDPYAGYEVPDDLMW